MKYAAVAPELAIERLMSRQRAELAELELDAAAMVGT